MNALQSIKAAIFIVLIFVFSSINLADIFSQDTTKNNYTGDWEADASWVDGTSPGTTANGVDLEIYGYITSNSDISFNNGLLTVHDTLVIKGNLTLLNNGDLTVDSAGVLIIFGDYLSYNQVQISNGGYFIVTGNFEMQGSDIQGSFDSDSGTVYIFDDTPKIKTGAGYEDLQCDNEIYYPDSCGYGSETHIIDDPIFDFVLEAGCNGSGAQPEISGSFEVYEGVGYSYTTTAGLNNYTWIVTDGTIVAGQGTNSVTVEWVNTGSSDIKVIYDSAGCISNSNTYSISVSSLPAECFSYRRQLTISNTVVDGGSDLTDFPYLVRIQNNSLRHIYQGGNITHPKGYDILFTQNADGTGILDHQTDYYDPVTGTLFVWVKIPSLSASANTIIYLFYGNYNITTDLSTDAVWAGDYVAVYHMGESLRDYGPTANYGINSGTTTTAGKIGLGRDFERDDRDYIFVTNEPDFRFDTTMTFSYWMYIESYPTAGGGANDWMDLLIKGDNVNFRLVCNRNTRNAYYAFGGGGFPDDLTSANNSVNPGAWIYVAGTWDGNYIPTNQRKKLFINNVRTNMDPLGQDLSLDFTYNTHSVLLGINEEAPDTRAFDGIMDEVRISRGWRSDSWILTEYNNQNNPAAYITVGGETQVYTPSAIGGTVDVEDVTIQARDYTRAVVTGYTGTIQWQYSTDNIDFHDIAGETSDTLVTDPLLETTYYRAFVTDAGCSAASTVDSVLIDPGFIDCEFNYRKKVTISPDNVFGTDNMSNFPVLIQILNNPDLRSVSQGGKVENSLGYDIAFTSEDGVTMLAHQIEEYDSINGSLTAWVRVPVLVAQDSTYLYMYYGNSAIVADPSTSATWTSDYVGVWHMGSDLTDATGNGNDGTNTGTGEVSGHIGNARSFDGSSNYITIANETNFDVAANGKLTVSGWVYVNSYTGGRQEQFVTKGTDGWFLRKYGTTGNDPEMYHQYLAGQYLQAYNSDGITAGSWHYLAATFDHAINNMFVYIDGSLANSIKNDPASSTITGNNNQVRFGADAGATPGNWFDGILDEIRIQSVSRTTDWIKTEYLNQSNPSAFIKIQDEETCITDPSSGTAYAEYSKVCQGQTTRIILTGSAGNIYWQSSTDSISWNFITGESDSVLIVGPLTDTMFYRASVSYCCELFSNPVRIDYLDEVPPVLSFVFDSVNCPGGNDGSIDLTITGGAAPLDLLWSTGSTNEDISGLIADYYAVTVTDNVECRVTDSVEVLEKNYVPLNVGNITGEVSSTQCSGYDPGAAIINPSGSTGTYSYQWQSGPDGLSWNNIAGATNSTYDPGILTSTTHYRVLVDPTGTPDCDTLTPSDNTVVITINPLPTAAIAVTDTSGTTDNDGIICSGDIATLTASGGTSYNWSSGETTAAITKGAAGTYTVTVTDVNGCTDIDSIAITTNSLPTASITIADTSGTTDNDGIICSGDIATLTAGGGASYSWSSGETTAAITKGAAGTYTVTVTDANGCKDTDAATVTVDPLLPVSVIIVEDQNNVCSGATVTFKASPTNEGTSPLYQWRVNGSPVGPNSDTYVYSPLNLDSVTVELTSDEACATNNPATSNAIRMIVYSANPGIFDVSGTGTYCTGGTGLPVTLNGSELGVSYQLIKDGTDDGLPVTGDGNPIIWNNRTAGTYTVVATNGCGSSDMNGTATIIMAGVFPAVFNVTGTGNYCFGGSGLPVNLSSSETGVNYQLQKDGSDDGLPVVGDGNPVTWNDKLEGTYKVTATNGCGTMEMNDSAVITEFNTPPTGDTNQIFCADNQTIDDLSATGTGIQWYSVPGGGIPLAGSELLINGSTYYASQSVDGCESDARLAVFITINPTPATSAISGNSAPVCFEEDVTYSVPLSANAKYFWNVPADATITSDTTGLEKNNITVSFGSISGDIRVVEINTYGCSGTEQILDIALMGCYLEAEFIADKTSICLGDTVVFTNLSQGTRDETQYQWTFGDAALPQSATGAGPHEVIYGQTGLKTVRLIITDGLTDTLTLSDYISVNPIPSATILEESICGEGLLLFTIEDSPQFDQVEFSNDTTRAFVDKDITPPYTHSEYLLENDSVMIWAKVYNSATGCASKWLSSSWGKSHPIPDSIIILNSLKPDDDFQDYLDILCTNDSGVYTVEAPVGSTITWNIPSLNIQDEMTETIRVYWDIDPGDYSVTAIETNIYGCQGPLSEAEVHISVPSVSIGEDVEVCQGETHTFTTSEPFDYYEWNDGSNLSTFTTGDEGIIKVTVADEYGCTASDSVMLTVNELPVLDLGNDTVLCGTGAYRLEATGFNTYQWSTGETGSYIFVYSGQQTISLTVTNSYGCSDTDTIQIIECSPVNLIGKITNAFTPNEDGNHDEWVINNIDIFPDAKIEVFDRWGRLVFSVDGGYKNDWKGTSNGKDLPVDNYYYVIDLKVPGSEPLTGTLTIIR